MNQYIVMGIKIFATLVLVIQTVICIGAFGAWADDYASDNSLAIIGLIVLFGYCITIPAYSWVLSF